VDGTVRLTPLIREPFGRGEVLVQVKWHIAFCNVTFTEYVGTTYRDYYASPANMLEAQLTARDVAEEKFGVGCFIEPHIDAPAVSFASYLGMPLIEPEDDELPYVDSRAPLLKEPADVAHLRAGDPKVTGLMAKRWEAWQYYRAQGHDVRFGGHGGPIITTAHELSAGNILLWLVEDPAGAERVLDAIADADLAIRVFDESLCGATDAAYTGDDFSGLLSPEMYRRFAIPRYERVYAGRSDRFMHSELLRAEHLRLAKDLLGITCFHGAGCENLTLAEMCAIMGHDFWTQLTPQELCELSPHAITEKVKEYAHSGAGYVQLYPGRGTPDAHMRAAIAAAEAECTGGRHV
jgi:uroporphyrinogen decarboxylase-like protein